MVRYIFGPIERRGVFGALRAGQSLVLALALLGAVLILTVGHSTAYVAAMLALVATALWLAFARVRGRTPEEWAPVLSSFAARRLTGGLSYRSRAPRAGVILPGEGGQEAQHCEALPAAVGDVEIVAVALPGAGEIGVAKDRRANTYTAALAARVRAFGLLAGSEQEEQVARWGGVLAALAREDSPIRRVGWLERTLPGDGEQIARYLEQHRDRALAFSSPALRSMLSLTDAALSVTQEHEIIVCVQLDGARARRQGKRLAKGEAGALALLARELDGFARQLADAGVLVEGALSPALYRAAIANGYDPFGRAVRSEQQRAEPPWPVASETEWMRYRTESATHVTYWVSQWPRIPVGASFLQPLLTETSLVRSVAVVMEPIAPWKATREAEMARTHDESDAETRARLGQVTTARHRQQAEASARREEELARGHGDYRFAAFVTLSCPGGDEDELERACADLERVASKSWLTLHRCYGTQDSSFTFTLPLCRGLA